MVSASQRLHYYFLSAPVLPPPLATTTPHRYRFSKTNQNKNERNRKKHSFSGRFFHCVHQQLESAFVVTRGQQSSHFFVDFFVACTSKPSKTRYSHCIRAVSLRLRIHGFAIMFTMLAAAHNQKVSKSCVDSSRFEGVFGKKN